VLLPWRSGGPVAIIGLQIVLATLAAWLVARLAGRVSSWPRAPLACGLIYAFLPQNLAFPHQLVTEAIVTPLCVAWLYAMLTAIRDRSMGLFLLAGLCLGAAILTRPVVLLMLPVPLALALACPGARPELRRPASMPWRRWPWRPFSSGWRSSPSRWAMSATTRAAPIWRGTCAARC
jgi:4-amino-4-deoxy-L-arabinose transferase-like glycosyltransferase